MIQSTNRAGASLLAQSGGTLGRNSRQRTSTAFARQLATAEEPTSASTEQTRGREGRRNLVSRGSARQDVVTSARLATPTPAVTPTPARVETAGISQPRTAAVTVAETASKPTAETTPVCVAPQLGMPQLAGAANAADTLPSDPVTVLTNALTAAGIGASGVKFTRLDEMVGYPGGSYRNHIITAEFSDGRRESFGVDLMMRNPRVTVAELGRMLGFNVSWEQLNRIQTPVQS